MARRPTQRRKSKLRLIPTVKALSRHGPYLPTMADREAILETVCELLDQTPTRLLIAWLPIFAQHAQGRMPVLKYLRGAKREPRDGA